MQLRGQDCHTIRGIATGTRLPVDLLWPEWICALWGTLGTPYSTDDTGGTVALLSHTQRLQWTGYRYQIRYQSIQMRKIYLK
jgi:hypothetical protein